MAFFCSPILSLLFMNSANSSLKSCDKRINAPPQLWLQLQPNHVPRDGTKLELTSKTLTLEVLKWITVVTIVEMKSYTISRKILFQRTVLDLNACCFQWVKTRGKIILEVITSLFLSTSTSTVCNWYLLKSVAHPGEGARGPCPPQGTSADISCLVAPLSDISGSAAGLDGQKQKIIRIRSAIDQFIPL